MNVYTTIANKCVFCVVFEFYSINTFITLKLQKKKENRVELIMALFSEKQ